MAAQRRPSNRGASWRPAKVAHKERSGENALAAGGHRSGSCEADGMGAGGSRPQSLLAGLSSSMSSHNASSRECLDIAVMGFSEPADTAPRHVKHLANGGATRMKLDELLQDLDDCDANVALVSGRHRLFNPETRKTSPKPEEKATSERPRRSARAMASRALERAALQFDAVDEGKLERGTVFEEVPPGHQRLDVKLEFFRDRTEMVLPPIESKFMCRDRQSGCHIVDVMKLRAQQKNPMAVLSCEASADDMPRPQSNPPRSPFQRRSLPHSARQMGPRPCVNSRVLPALLSEGGRLEEQCSTLSKYPSTKTLSMSTSASMESLLERAARLQECGKVRDLYAASVRNTERGMLSDRRLMQLDELQQKALRKTSATRQRLWGTWMAAALAMETFIRLWKSFKMVYAVRNEVPGLLADAKSSQPSSGNAGELLWKHALAKVNMPSSLSPLSRKQLMRSFTERLSKEAYGERRSLAQKNCGKLVYATRFIGKLLLQLRMHRSAALIVHFIQASWRGYSTRSNVKYYMRHIRLIQRSFRFACRIREYVCQYIILPSLWQVETELLGKTIKLPKVALANILEAQTRILDVQQRIVEVQQMSNWRRLFLMARPAQEGCPQEMASVHARCSNAEQMLQTAHQDILDSICRSRCCTVTSTGKAVPMPGAARQGLRTRATHPMMDKVDKRRLPTELRQQVVRFIYRENRERFWVRYKHYKAEKLRFKQGWDNWRISATVLGPGQKAAWPPYPPLPRYPYEITTLNMQQLRKTVHSLLKLQSETVAQPG